MSDLDHDDFDRADLDQLLAEFAARPPSDAALARAARRLAGSIRELGKAARMPLFADVLAGQAEDLAQALEDRQDPLPEGYAIRPAGEGCILIGPGAVSLGLYASRQIAREVALSSADAVARHKAKRRA